MAKKVVLRSWAVMSSIVWFPIHNHAQGGDTRILNTVIRWTRLTRQKKKWVDSLYLYDNTPIICSHMKRHDLGQSPTELLWRHFFANLDFITVLRRLINYCSTPKTASYNYSLEKLLWNVKFYLNQYFSQTSSHEIVRRNVKLTREILNLDSKIKHLSPVYKKKTSKSCADDSKASLVWVRKRTEHDLTLSPNLFFWASSTWCRRPKYFPYVHI